MAIQRADASQTTAGEFRKEAATLLVSGCGHQDVTADAAYEPVGKG